MKRALLGSFSLCTRNLLVPPPRLNPNANQSLVQLAVTTHSRLSRFCSSESNSSSLSKFDQTQKTSCSIDDADGAVSAQELKKQVEKLNELEKQMEKLNEGDETALLSIFESILERKLAGVPDDDLRKEFNLQSPQDDSKDEDFDSDFEDALDDSDKDSDA